MSATATVISPAFDLLERLLDSVIGVGVAWAFSYVLPSWEKAQLGAVMTRDERRGRTNCVP